eukprot:7874933-Lingulodinium_polyedra.AAC.1
MLHALSVSHVAGAFGCECFERFGCSECFKRPARVKCAKNPNVRPMLRVSLKTFNGPRLSNASNAA